MTQGNFVYLTKPRLVEIEKELKEMKTNGRKDAAKEEQGLFELKISQIEDILSRARVIEKSQFPNDKVHILANVKIKNLKTKKTINYTLVSPEEADFHSGKISVISPVGKSLMGTKVGDKVKVKAPAGLLEFEILNID
jgi:transcription elongation factor GreA